MPESLKILLVRLSHLGDVVHAVPVLRALRAAQPEAELGWVVQPEFADLIRPLSGLDRVFLFNRQGGLREWIRVRSELRSWGPDWVVDAQGNYKSAAVTWCSGAPVRHGPAPQDWQEPRGAKRLTHPAPPSYGAHAMHKMAALLERIAPDQGLDFDLEPSDEELAAGRAALEERCGAPGPGQLWILHLGAPGDPRSWPADRFAELARRLGSRGDSVLVLSGPAESVAGASVEDDLRRSGDTSVAHWIGQLGLRELVGVLSAAGERGARMVVGDSGPAHLAAACGLGVDMLSGPQDPGKTGPWPLHDHRGSPHRVLRSRAGEPAPITELSLEAVVEKLMEPAPGA